jgi:uncharacterized membrane protein
MMVAPVVGLVVGNVASVIGASLITSAWVGEAPKRSGLVVGLGMLGLGTTLTIVANQRVR